MRIQDGNNSYPGCKKVESRIRDKHPGSATLKDSVSNTISLSTVLKLTFHMMRVGSLSWSCQAGIQSGPLIRPMCL
jgi:hypothetical protein